MKKLTKEQEAGRALLEKISDYDILTPFEDVLNNMSLEQGLGYFTGEIERDEKGVKIVLRVAAMVDNAGPEEFMKNEKLKSVEVEYIDHNTKVIFDVVEAVPVSGMEIEVVYRPR